jgi:hypothetical protein
MVYAAKPADPNCFGEATKLGKVEKWENILESVVMQQFYYYPHLMSL